ncbi:hypothetical protein MVEN_02501900 [Mycena venus]|uniref:F-box domain-containing protein n=1 Tax=Mycena venus TaxID=2733690 RepID=A0A8H6U2F9_9AGAR|nr:hypothetical protein MVEN_02501900 [Mycena venus]
MNNNIAISSSQIGTSRLASLCPELRLTILRHCSPMDLVSLRQLSPFRAILFAHPSCWVTARAALGVPGPVPGTTEVDHARKVFGGGTCIICAAPTDELVLSYGLEIRCCPRCHGTAYRKLPGLMTIPYPQLDSQLDTNPALRWTPFQTTPTGLVCRKSDLAVMTECFRKLQDEDDFNAELEITTMVADQVEALTALQLWQKEYTGSKAVVADANLKFLRDIAAGMRVKCVNLLDCPTIFRVFHAFNRDLTRMGAMDWATIRKQVLAELQSSGVRTPAQCAVHTKVRLTHGCQRCPPGSLGRLTTDAFALAVHTSVMHR